MDSFCCSIVPPYILEHIAEGQHPEASRLAKQTLSAAAHLYQCRVDLDEHRRGGSRHFTQHLTQNIVPGYVLEDISKAEGTDEATEKQIAQTIISSQQISQQRLGDSSAAAVTTTDTQLKINRSVFDMAGLFEKQGDVDVSDKFLPGKLVRSEGQAAVADKAVNQVYDHTKEVLEFLHSVFKYNSVDGQNMPIVSSVHSLSVLLNASWVGVDTKAVPPKKYNQMLYGDGIQGIMEDFTDCVDLIGHEMMHAVTQFNSGLKYKDESGALNEHLSDVMGVMIRQAAEKKLANDDNWLVGEKCFLPDQKGTALRNMKNPGTAYKAQFLLGGNDPQPADVAGMEAYKRANPEILTKDHGGVHIFSGIPNRAFVICALAFGGKTWDKAGQIWWLTATSRRIPDECTFLQFADVTVVIAQEKYGASDAQIVRNAWNTVGVVRRGI